ncbi:MAG: phosphomannomutase, partial [Candidatus Aenigmarchaeota archaeon]|nr:phosphomannomutase [Candidatus Aenigmarchaeota archaeon]
MEVDKNIFRAYDIRGKYPAQINEELANKIGKAYGNLIGAGKEIIIGKDLRSSGETLKKALIEGINFAGVNVIDIGTVPTPVVYFAICRENKHGGLVVTGSHLTYGWNGIKLCRENADCMTYETGIKEILDNVVNDNFQEAEEKGNVVKKDIVEEYVEYLRSKVKLDKRLKVIIDIGNGTGGEIAKKLFERLDCDVKFLFPEPDETFPNHVADPIKEDTLACLQETVLKEKADIGIAFDGDCDRAGFVDDKGNIVRGDMALILFAKSALKNKETRKFLFEVRCSRLTYEIIKKMGGDPEFMRVGHSYIMQR